MIGVGTTIFLVNPTTFPSAAFPNDYSLLFDGVDEEATSDNFIADTFKNSSSFSCSLWVKRGSGSSGTEILLGTEGTGGTNQMLCAMSNGIPRFTFATNYVDGSTTLSIGTWYHLTYVFDGTQSTNITKARVFINGVDDTSSSTGT